ncbi:hypothetical protein [Bacillus cereus group sp. BfR-BA-01309]|uniref:hypothetical protein n=1 Tax=Bacillus cereus group sp. BfR-BA-01309 TaxID=2920286 RepID=UPI001F5ADEA0|nr:hypothetical protein [Bacillus cereus group sp. BfR-BA-01309]
MYKIFQSYTLLKSNKGLDSKTVAQLINEKNILPLQWSSLSVLLELRKNKTVDEKNLLSYSKQKSGNPESWYKILNGLDSYSDKFEEIIYKTFHQEQLGEQLIAWIVDEFEEKSLCNNFLSFWLMLLNVRDISFDDTVYLTEKLLHSGEIVNYKSLLKDSDTYFARRYPTGGLSEKVALILPSLLAATKSVVNIKSNFLVAKTLSHTGGTVDKLSSIKGFYVPHSTSEIVNTLENFGVVMSSTGDTIAPVDERLYSFRSISGTVEADSLIISSIASKQLALPTDYLLMDIRYGSGAFISDEERATDIGKKLSGIFEKFGQANSFALTAMEEPNGSGIGNVFEVIEAVEIMDPNFKSDLFNEKLKCHQKGLVLDFYSKLMSYYDNSRNWLDVGSSLFDDGKVIEKFYELLTYHGVDSREKDKIKKGILDYFEIGKMFKYKVKSKCSGKLSYIDQKQLGYLVNYEVNFDSHLNTKLLNGGGLVINNFIGDYVKKDATIATLYSKKEISCKILDSINESFIIKEEC